jgi:hypothetical protein
MWSKFSQARKIEFFYYRIMSFFSYILELVVPSRINDYKKIPIIINNFNRLETLKQLIGSLEIRGYYNIYIIDNLSTYPPLLDYYGICPYTVIRLDKNVGMEALWRTDICKKLRNDFFVYTDSDIVPIEECPADFMLFFLETLKKYKLARKVGFSLKIDDLPDYYTLKDEVINHEKQYFELKRDDLLYWAPIDTTFALYRPRGLRRHGNYSIEMYRTAYPYMARHIPWYVDSNNPDEENRYFLENSKTQTCWTRKSQEILNEKKGPI